LLHVGREAVNRAFVSRAAAAALRLAAVAFAAAPAALAGCGDDCRDGEARCQSGLALNCAYTSHEAKHTQWSSEDCRGTACVLASTGRAYCALGAEPDPRCGVDDSSEAAVCAGSVPAFCVQGYLVSSRTDCQTAGDVCIDAEGAAFCAESPEPDPRCSNAGSRTAACADNALLYCSFGFRTSVLDCTDGRVCLDDPIAGLASCELP
jgi:hypothetical protein